MQIAQNIKKLRDEKDLMQKEVANAVGVHPPNYSKMDKGEREFSIEVIDKLAKFFGLSIDELVHLNGKKYLKLLPLNTKLPEMLTKSKF